MAEVNVFPVNKKVFSILKFAHENIFSISPNVNCWIAGGSLLRQYMNVPMNDSDIDVYFPSEENYKIFVNTFKSKPGARIRRDNDNSTLIQLVDNSLSYYPKLIDCVKIFKESPIESIKSFDFTVCGVAADRDNVYMHESFIKDVSDSTIRINNKTYAGSSIFRLSKYIKNYQFKLPYNSFVELINASSELSNKELYSGEDFIEMLSDIADKRYQVPSANICTIHDVLCAPALCEYIKKYFEENNFDFNVIEDFIIDNVELSALPEYVNMGKLNAVNILKKTLKHIMLGKKSYVEDIFSHARVTKDTADKQSEKFMKFFISKLPDNNDIKKYLTLL